MDATDVLIGALMIGMTISVGLAAYHWTKPTVGAQIKQKTPLRDIGVLCLSRDVEYPQSRF